MLQQPRLCVREVARERKGWWTGGMGGARDISCHLLPSRAIGGRVTWAEHPICVLPLSPVQSYRIISPAAQAYPAERADG